MTRGAEHSTSTVRGIFVYGTLRRGFHNATMLPAEADVRPAEADGELRWAFPDDFGYPVFVPADACALPGIVHGEVVDVAPADVPDVVRMELGAGYHLERIRLRDGTDVWAFTWRRGTDEVGSVIESGDFVAAAA